MASQCTGAAVRDRFLGGEVMNLLSIFFRVLMKKYWVSNRKKRLYREMWEDAF